MAKRREPSAVQTFGASVVVTHSDDLGRPMALSVKLGRDTWALGARGRRARLAAVCKSAGAWLRDAQSLGRRRTEEVPTGRGRSGTAYSKGGAS